MTQAQRLAGDELAAEQYELVLHWLNRLSQHMSPRQLLALADGMHEMYMRRSEVVVRSRGSLTPHPRRRWTDRALSARRSNDAEVFTEILEDAIRAAVRDKAMRGDGPGRS